MSPLRSVPPLLLVAFLVSGNAWALGRDGQLDDSFGNDGKAVHAFPGNLFLSPSGAVDMSVLPDGKLLLSGAVINGAGDEDFAAIRLHPDGSLDTGYGSNGGRRIGFDRANSSRHDNPVGMVLQSDGKAVLAGYAAGDPATDGQDMAVVRLTTGGQLDSSFGTGGRVLVPFNLGPVGVRHDAAIRISQQADGKLLLVGWARAVDHDRLAIVRLTGTGQRDVSFGGDGRVDLDFAPDYEDMVGLQVRQLAAGGILAVGYALPAPGGAPSADFVMVKLLDGGGLDPAFGDGGRQVFDFAVGGSMVDQAYDFVELPDGRLLVCGAATVNSPNNLDMACVRLLADGTPDAGFPALLVPFDRGGDLQDAAARLVRDAQGRFLLAGPVRRDIGNSDFAIARLLPDGSLDPAFGNGGLSTLNSCVVVCAPGEYDNVATSIAVQPDGRILLAGWVANANGDYRFMITRQRGDVIFSAGFEP